MACKDIMGWILNEFPYIASIIIKSIILNLLNISLSQHFL